MLLIPFLAHGQDDIYRVKTPNVMIIFDTSNSMEQQPNGLSQGSGTVRVDSEGRVVSAPFGTVYDFEGKGNHPNSKLYQAKLALKEILQTVVKDRVNLGFSTYAQSKSPDHMWGYYWRQYRYYYPKTDPTWYWQKLYWGYYPDRHSWSTTVFTKDSFKDEWGTTHVGVKVGYTFSRVHSMNNSWNNNKMNVPPPHPPGTFLGDLKYTVTSIVYNAEYNWYTYTYYSDYHDQYWEGNRTIYTSDDLPINCDQKFTKTWPQGSWTAYTYDSKDNEQKNNPAKWQCKGPFVYDTGHDAYFGNWTDQWTWSDRGEVASCEDTVGSDDAIPAPGNYQYKKWSLVAPNCVKWSEYTYPADGTSNKPHTWSYFKTNAGKWPKSGQTPNYYPSKDGSGKFNSVPNTFDDHTFFVNFPDDKDANFKDSDRTGAKNLILSFMDVTPVKSPGAPNWAANKFWTKLPMHDLFGKKGLTSYTQASGFTPLADSLLYANLYFSDYIFNYNGGDISSQNTMDGIPCRGNYIVLLTDGLESARLKAGLPDYDAAAVEAKALLDINVKTFVIGFGQDIVGNQTLNNMAKAGGTDKAYFAADLVQLKQALQVIFQMISNQFYGRSNPVITRTRDRLFRGAFEIKDGDYYGHMMAWDADRMTGALAPEFAWDSGEVMASAGRGTVYTWVEDKLNPSKVLFDPEDSNLYPLVNPSGEDTNNDNAFDIRDAKAVIKFTLDSKYNDCTDGVVDKDTLTCHGPNYYKGKRPLDWVLGDIYHSTPVVVGEPSFFFTENNYKDFYNANKGRETMIYVGTNDGMLHGFRNSSGAEKFAVIPRSLLGKLKNLNAAHDFYVDASPKAYDVYFASESKWKTVIISGLRGGGPYYFALDVTNPADPKILWEWTHPNMGQAWAKPDIGRVKVGATTKFVAFIPGGYSSTDDKGNSFYILDIETGTALKTWAKSNSMPVGDSKNKIPSGPTAFDSDMDGFVNYVYFGDIQGTMWKVDVSSTSVADWTLYDFWKDESPKRRPIFYAPAVAKNDEGKTLVYFGTGDEFNLTSDQVNYFYEVEDQGATGKQVWTRNLDPGEKVLSSPSVANWVVYFTTWTYTGHGERCGAGEGRLYGLLISKVGAPGASEGLVTMDPNTGKWTEPQSSITLGAGIPSAPLVTNGMIYIATSLNANRVIQIPIPGWAVARTRSWREVF
jgi:hypothetical protein